MTVGEICIREVVFTSGERSVREAAELMERHHVGDLLVVERDGPGELEPLGIVTDRDLVTKVLACGKNPETVRVQDVMAEPLVTALEREEPTAVLERMKSFGVRRVPVVGEGGELVGILTYDDLVGWLGEELGELSEVVARGLRRERGFATTRPGAGGTR